MMSGYVNYYKEIEQAGEEFSTLLGVENVVNLLSFAGDKADGYKYLAVRHGIRVYQLVMIYLLSYVKPYSGQVRDTETGWVPVQDWLEKMILDPVIQSALAQADKKLQ